MNDHIFLGCIDSACGLRFPAPVATNCPRCKGRTEVVDERYENKVLRATPYPLRLELLFDNLRSIHNVGSILRTAEATHFSAAYCCGITPPPDHPKLAKTALGAEKRLDLSYHTNASAFARNVREQNDVVMLALESRQDARNLMAPFSDAPSCSRVLVVVGNEIAGVSPEVLAQCHYTLALPMQGEKNSLNVGHAFSVLAYALAYGHLGQALTTKA